MTRKKKHIFFPTFERDYLPKRKNLVFGKVKLNHINWPATMKITSKAEKITVETFEIIELK